MASTRKKTLKSGAVVWQSIWREAGRQRTRNFPRHAEARAFAHRMEKEIEQRRVGDPNRFTDRRFPHEALGPIESLLALKHIKPGIWLENAREFDRTVRFFNAALQMFRPPDRSLPPNAVLAPPEHQHLIETSDEKAAHAALLALLAQIASADASGHCEKF